MDKILLVLEQVEVFEGYNTVPQAVGVVLLDAIKEAEVTVLDLLPSLTGVDPDTAVEMMRKTRSKRARRG